MRARTAPRPTRSATIQRVTLGVCKTKFLTTVRDSFNLDNVILTRRLVSNANRRLSAATANSTLPARELTSNEFIAFLGLSLFSSSPEYLDLRAELLDFFHTVTPSPRVARLLTREVDRVVIDWSVIVHLFHVLDDSKPSCVDAVVEFFEHLASTSPSVFDRVVDDVLTVPPPRRQVGSDYYDSEEEDEEDDNFEKSKSARKRKRKPLGTVSKHDRREVILGVGEAFAASPNLKADDAMQLGICVWNRLTRNRNQLVSANTPPRPAKSRGRRPAAKKARGESEDDDEDDEAELEEDEESDEDDEDNDEENKLGIWFPRLACVQSMTRREVAARNELSLASASHTDQSFIALVTEARLAFLLTQAFSDPAGNSSKMRLVARILHDRSPKYPSESTLRELISILPKPLSPSSSSPLPADVSHLTWWTDIADRLRSLGAERLSRDLTRLALPSSSYHSPAAVTPSHDASEGEENEGEEAKEPTPATPSATIKKSTADDEEDIAVTLADTPPIPPPLPLPVVMRSSGKVKTVKMVVDLTADDDVIELLDD